MTKRKQRNKGKRKTVRLSVSEKILRDLHKVVKNRGGDAQTADSLIRWYREHQEWTYLQIELARKIINNHDVPKKPHQKEKEPFMLYAITDGATVKLGYSREVDKRLKELQTANPNVLTCLWQRFAGEWQQQARNNEAWMHKHCKEHHIRGEWFSLSVMECLESFIPKKY